MKTSTLNSKFISFQNPGSRVLAVQSGKGTGKTRWLQDNLSDVPALFLSHRVSLTKDIAQRNKTAHYAAGSEAYKSSRLTITLDSLPALFHSEVHKGTTVIIDEATQVARHFVGGTLKGKRLQVAKTLQKHLYFAKQVILLDADLNLQTVEFFCDLMKVSVDSDDVTWITNTWNPKNRKFIEFPSKEVLEVDLLASVKAGLKCYIASDSKSTVKAVTTFLASKIEGLTYLSVHGDNSKDELEAAFIADVNNQQLQYQVVAGSPSLATGVDINQPHFDKVYLIAEGTSLLASDLMQACSRVRTVKDVHFWVNPTFRKEETNWERILERKQQVTWGSRTGFHNFRPESMDDISWAWDYDVTTDSLVVKDAGILHLLCQTEAALNSDLNNLRSAFLDAAGKEGTVTQFQVTPNHETLANAVKKETRDIRAQVKQNEVNEVVVAPVITEDQATVMAIAPELLTKEESLSLKRHRLLEKVGGIEEHLTYAVENEVTLYKATRILGYLNRDDQELAAQDNKETANCLTVDRHFRSQTKQLVSEFLTIINYWNSIEKGEELREYYGECRYGSYDAVSYWLTHNAKYVKELLGVTVAKDVDKKPMQTIQAILKVLGLAAEQGRQKRVKLKDAIKLDPICRRYQRPSLEIEQKGENHSEQVRPYYASKEAHQRMFQILEAREAKYQAQKTAHAEALPF